MLTIEPATLKHEIAPPFHELRQAPHCTVVVQGRILGYADGDTTRGAEQTTQDILDTIFRDEDPTEIIRWSIGSFVVVLIRPDTITLIASPAGPGCYLVHTASRIQVVFEDRDMVRHAGTSAKIEYLELLNYIFAKPYPSRAPFCTLFRNVDRLPGGATARIVRGGKIDSRMYIHEAPRLGEHTYARFKRIFEDTTRLSCEGAQDRDLFAMVSGGIDSAVAMLAAIAVGYRPTAMHWRKTQLLNNTVHLLCTLAETPLEFCGRNYFLPDPLKLDWNRAQAIYESSLGVIGFNQVLTGMGGRHGAYLTGMAFGNILQVNAAMRVSFGETTCRRVLNDTRLKKPLRYLFTPGFLNAVRQGRGQTILDRVSALSGIQSPTAPRNIAEYLFHLTLTNDVPYFSASALPQAFDAHVKAHANHIETRYLARILGPELYERIRSDGGSSLSNPEITNLSRLIRFAMQVQRTSKNDSCYAAHGGFTLLSTPMEGPVLSYCMTRPIGWKDVIRPKHFLFRYFKERLGISYADFLAMDRKRRKSGNLDDHGGGPQPNEDYRHAHTLVFESDDFREHFPKVVDPDNSAVIDRLECGAHRDEIAALYRDCREKPTTLPLCNQLLNLELFLRANEG